MSSLPPPPAQPSNNGPGPAGPPGPSGPAGGGGVSRGVVIGLIVAAVVLLGAGVAVAVALTSGSGDPSSVEDVADAAIAAAEDLDVDAGARLMCEAPSQSEREDLEDAIAQVQDQTGEDDPEVSYEVTEVEETDDGGTAVIEATGEDPALEGAFLEVELEIQADGDTYCIDEVRVLDGSEPN